LLSGIASVFAIVLSAFLIYKTYLEIKIRKNQLK